MDVSPSGVGMMISENNRNFLKNNRFLWMTEIDRQILKDPILAEVVYMTSDVDHKTYKKRQKELKVGLKLSSQFPKDLIEKVTK